MRVIVICGTTFIGSEIVNRLVAPGRDSTGNQGAK
jgi:hypothetical protein